MSGLKFVSGSDALELMLDIRLDGFATGYASAIFAVAGYLGMTEAEAEQFSDKDTDRLLQELKRDPLAMEAQRQEILQRLNGVDSGPYTIKTAGGGA